MKAVDLVWDLSDPKGSAILGHVLELKRLRRNVLSTADAADDESDANASSGGDDDDASIDSDEARGPLVKEVTSATADAADGIVTTLEIGYRNKYHAENLEPSARYVFRVAACNGEGQGHWSPWSDSFNTLQPAAPPPASRGRRTNARGATLFPGASKTDVASA